MTVNQGEGRKSSTLHANLPSSGGQSLEAPQSVEAFGCQLASWPQRLLALLIDALLVWGAGSIVLMIVGALASTTIVDPWTGGSHRFVPYPFNLAGTIVFAAQLIYFAQLDGRTQTIGKRAVGIAVRDRASGQAIGFGRALGRWLIFDVLWYLLIVPGLLNALSPIWDREHQAWHDHAVGSVVIRTR